MSEAITSSQLDGIAERMTNMPDDKNRLRVMKVGIENFTFTCEQASKLVALFHMSDPMCNAAIALYPSCVDKDNFDSTVLAQFKFDEEKDIVRKACSV